MKRVPVLSLCGLVAAGLLAAPAMAAAPFANKTPDVVVGLGLEVENAFNLNDFFSSTDTADLDFSEEGPVSVDADGNVSIVGSSQAGMDSASFSSGDTTVESHIIYASTVLGNRPFIDDNNRIASMAGGNMFLNALVPGTSVSSSLPLTGIGAILEAGGANGVTPGGVTPAGGALIAAIGDIDMAWTESGLLVTDKFAVAVGDGSASYDGLSVSVNADGSYTISADADFDEWYYVTVGADAGSFLDVVQMIAAPATQVGGSQTVNVAPGATESIALEGVDVSGLVSDGLTLIANYSTDSADVKIAVIGIEDNGSFHFAQPGGANLSTSGSRDIAVTFATTGGAVSPMIQIDNLGGSAATVTINSVLAVDGPFLTDVGTNPNASLALGADGSMADGLAGWNGDVLGQGEGSPSLVAGENNFNTPTSAGAALLAGAQHGSGVANMGIISTLTTGTYTAEAFVKNAGGEGSFFLVVTDGGPNTAASVVPSAAISSDEWQWVAVSTTGVETGGAFVVLQAAGCDILVDDVRIAVIDEHDTFFDARLAGL